MLIAIVVIIIIVCLIWGFNTEDEQSKKAADNIFWKALKALGKLVSYLFK